ncbi:hypothetical protein I4F81_012199 [Pyropia yezoensis]|uniref:Uncharacterized protein n=1 Tax=Pyropia yezoensis TaxID=2788 RepID=A0ACC3CIU4_PYRYE|nr:hypothetical protein I4F81_012199 [Neopyropia yezoensis]
MGRFSAATVVAVAAAATALLACPADARLVGSARQADVAAAVLDETPYRTEEALVDVGFETAEPVDDFLGEEELPAETEAVLGEEELPAETGAVLGEEELPAETEAVLGDEVYPTHTPYPSEEVAVEPMAYPVQTAMPYSMPTAVVQEGKPVYSGPRPAETGAVLGDEVYPTHTPYPSEEVAVEPMAYPVQTAMPYSMPTAVVQEGKPVYSGPRPAETGAVLGDEVYPTHTPYPSEEVAVEPMAYPVQTAMPYSMPTAVVQEGKPVYSGPRPAETGAVLGDEVYPTHTPYPSEEVAVEPMAYPVQTAMPYSMPTAVVQEGKPVYSGPRKFAPTLAAAQQMTYDAYMQWLSAMPAPYVPIHQQQKPVYTPVTKKVVVAKQPVLVQAPRPVKPLAAVQQLPFLVPHGQGLGRPGPRVVTASGVTSYSAEVAA